MTKRCKNTSPLYVNGEKTGKWKCESNIPFPGGSYEQELTKKTKGVERTYTQTRCHNPCVGTRGCKGYRPGGVECG